MGRSVDAVRVRTVLVTAARLVQVGVSSRPAALLLVDHLHPTRCELRAARQTNLDLHSGTHRRHHPVAVAPAETPLVRVRRQIDDVLLAASTLTP